MPRKRYSCSRTNCRSLRLLNLNLVGLSRVRGCRCSRCTRLTNFLLRMGARWSRCNRWAYQTKISSGSQLQVQTNFCTHRSKFPLRLSQRQSNLPWVSVAAHAPVASVVFQVNRLSKISEWLHPHSSTPEITATTFQAEQETQPISLKQAKNRTCHSLTIRSKYSWGWQAH